MSSFTHKATAVKLGSSGWPVDERSGRAKTHKIHADGLDEDEFTLIFTDPRHNANKFHTVQLLQPLLPDGEWRLYQRQGRVGQVGTKKEMRSGSEMILKWEFCEIYKSKTGRHWMDRDFCSAKTGEYAHIPHDPQIQELRGDDGAVHEVVRLVYPDRTLRSHPTWYKMQYDSARLPLGPVSGQAMEAAQAVLAALDKLLSTCIPVTNAASLTELSKSYYTYIPHAFTVAHGVPVINTRRLLDKEQRYLKEVQKEMKALQWIQEEPSHTKSMITLNELGVDEFASVKKCTSEYTALKEYCTSFRGSTHGHITYAIVDIFRVERTEERRRFGATSGTGHDNRRLLWHGSPLTNFAGILKEGLQVKTPADKGNMFGRGIYFANVCSKSVQYCSKGVSVGVTSSAQRTGLLLLCEVQLGDTLECSKADKSGDVLIKRKEKDSISAMGQMGPAKMRDAGDSLRRSELSGVMMPCGGIVTNHPKAKLFYDEFVVYDPALVRIRYIFRLAL